MTTMTHSSLNDKPKLISPVYFFLSDYPILIGCLMTLVAYYNPTYLFHSPESIVRVIFESTSYSSWVFHSIVEPYINWIFWGMIVLHVLETIFILVPVLRTVNIDRTRDAKLWWVFIILGLCDGYRTVRRIKITLQASSCRENSITHDKGE